MKQIFIYKEMMRILIILNLEKISVDRGMGCSLLFTSDRVGIFSFEIVETNRVFYEKNSNTKKFKKIISFSIHLSFQEFILGASNKVLLPQKTIFLNKKLKLYSSILKFGAQ